MYGHEHVGVSYPVALSSGQWDTEGDSWKISLTLKVCQRISTFPAQF